MHGMALNWYWRVRSSISTCGCWPIQCGRRFQPAPVTWFLGGLGDVLRRTGRTEVAVDLAWMAGQYPRGDGETAKVIEVRWRSHRMNYRVNCR